jgi:hypothetical protein
MEPSPKASRGPLSRIEHLLEACGIVFLAVIAALAVIGAH